MHHLIQLGVHHSALAIFQSSGGTTGFFQSLWTSDLSAVKNLATSGAIFTTAIGILSVVLIIGVYEVFTSGADIQGLFVLMVKVAACGLLIANWDKFFTDITTNGSFALASSINSTDFFTQMGTAMKNQVSSLFSTFSFFNIFSDYATMISVVECALAMIVYYIAYYIMQFCFTLWGLILYCLGPLLVALIPSKIAGSFGTAYIKGLVQWLSWPVLFAIVAALEGALEQSVVSDGAFSKQALQTNVNNSQIGWIVIVYSIVLLMIPFIANRILSGDFAGSVGSALQQAVGAAMTVASAGVGAAMGGSGMLSSTAGGASSGGAGAASGSGAGGASAAGGGGGGTPGGGSGGVSAPPASPSSSSSGGGTAGGGGGAPSGGGSADGGGGTSGGSGGSPWQSREAGGTGPVSSGGGSSSGGGGGTSGGGGGGTSGGGGGGTSGGGGGETSGGGGGETSGGGGPSSSGGGETSGGGGPSSSGGGGGTSGGGGGTSGGGGWGNTIAGAAMGASGGFKGLARAGAAAHFQRSADGVRSARQEARDHAGDKAPPASEDDSYQMSFGDIPHIDV